MLTDRLEIRPLVEADRGRFVELSTDPDFMVFCGVQTAEAAQRSVDHLIAANAQVPFAKQPIIERSTGTIIGYAGVDWFQLDDRPELEFGYRLVPAGRGLGYATEAGLALLDVARGTFEGTIYGLIDQANTASIATIGKLGFEFWKQDLIDDEKRNLYRWHHRAPATL